MFEHASLGVDTFIDYTPYEGLNLANQKNRKLEVFGQMLEGNHTKFDCHFHKSQRK